MEIQTQPASTASSLDPQLVNLAKSLRQTESNGDFTAKGKSGEYGAYQWMPSTWAAKSKEAGVNVPLAQATPEQQNEVAYKTLATWKQQHPDWNIGNYASAWNAGEGAPDAYLGNSGTNAEGVKYDTPAYAKKVAENYQQIKNQSQSQGGSFVNPQQQPQTSNFVQPPPAPANVPDQNPQTPQPEGNFLQKAAGVAGGIYNAVTSPFLGVAAAPVQGLAKLLGQPDPYARGIQGYGGSTSVTPLDLEKKAGDVAQVGSYFVPGSGVLGATGMGVLQGAGSAMSQGGDLAQVATGGAEGGILGGATAGATKLLGSGVSKVGDLISGESASKATSGIRDAYSSALNLNTSERALENRSGKDLAQVLVDNQAPLGRHENGTLDASKALPILQKKLQPLNQQADKILSHPQGIVKNVSIPEVYQSVVKKIDAMTLPEVDKEDAKQVMSSYLTAEVKKYGLDLSPAQADKIKQGFWAATFDRNRTNLQNHIPYLLGKEMQTVTEKAVAGTDTETDLHALNQQRGDLIDAIRRLQKMDGVKLLKGGRLGNIVSGTIGAIAGAASGLGPLGALGGDYFGQKAGQFLQNPATKIAIANYKAKALGSMGGLIGKASVPVGKVINKTGNTISKSARATGLMSNLLAK